MKKDIQKAALAAIIGAFVTMTGCGQSHSSGEKKHGASCNQQVPARSDQDHTRSDEQHGRSNSCQQAPKGTSCRY